MPASQRIFIRATNWVGDAVMVMPAVQRLRELYPDAHIALLTPAKLHDLWRHNPHLNEILTDPATIRTGNFDTAIIFPNSFRTAWETWRAGIPRRIGFAGHWRRALLTDIVPEPANETARYETLTLAGKTFRRKVFPVIRHQVHRYLDLVAHLGGNRDLIPPKIWCGDAAAKKFLPADGKPVLALNAGAEFGPAKRWPAERFAEVAKRVAKERDCRWLLLGGPGDVALAGQIEAALTGIPVVNVAGKTTLLELCELLRAARLLLTNDTGPMHVAAAVGTPLIAIFGSTSPELTGPLSACLANSGTGVSPVSRPRTLERTGETPVPLERPRQDAKLVFGDKATILRQPVECSPCFLRECPIDFRCMNRITVEQVTAAVLQQL